MYSNREFSKRMTILLEQLCPSVLLNLPRCCIGIVMISRPLFQMIVSRSVDLFWTRGEWTMRAFENQDLERTSSEQVVILCMCRYLFINSVDINTWKMVHEMIITYQILKTVAYLFFVFVYSFQRFYNIKLLMNTVIPFKSQTEKAQVIPAGYTNFYWIYYF